MKKEACPVCSSKNLQRSNFDRLCELPFCTSFSVKQVEYLCNDCSNEGDFFDENDAVFEKAKKEALKSSVGVMLGKLSALGISNAKLERALGLAPRTIARWKSGGFSESAIVLLRILASFPWLVETAANTFDKRFSDSQIIQQAGLILGSLSDRSIHRHNGGSTSVENESRAVPGE